VGVAGEHGAAGGGELVAVGGADDERVEAVGGGVDGGVAEPGRVLAGGGGVEHRHAWIVAHRAATIARHLT
jgi:hypothetical protein